MSQRSPASRADDVRARRVLDALEEGILVRDAHGAIVDWNAASLRMLDLTLAELLGRKTRQTGWQIVADDGTAFAPQGHPIAAALDRAAGAGRALVRVLGPDRAAIYVTITAHAEDDEGETTFTLGDVTAQREAQRENERYREIIGALDASHRILEESPIAICSVDVEGRILRSNLAFLGLAGIETQSIFALMAADDRDVLRESFGWVFEGSMPSVRRETRLARPAGPAVWCEVTAVAMRQGLPDAAILVMVNDVTERREREARLRRLAERDPLTGVHNRRSFVDVLSEQLRVLRNRGRRAATDHALLLIDLDGFKDVNDTCGHAGGDAVLIAVAAAIRERSRAADTVGRLGGDEFAALLELRDAASATSIAQEMIDRIGDASSAVEGAPRISASIGIVHLDPQCSAAQTLEQADRAMYCAKHAGKARSVDAGICTADDAAPSPEVRSTGAMVS
jgi:diguanylate cyclase (GGDEF)-like protein/PAS domain S-box-containing protein